MNALQTARTNFQIERLVPQINQSHAKAQEAGRDMLQHMLEAGKGLAAMKEVVKHGQFEAAIEEQCEFSVATAQRYMKLFHNWPKIEELVGEGEAVDLSLRGALKLIQSSKPAAESGAKAGSSMAEAVSKAARVRPIALSHATQPDICPKGGAHEWIDDEEDGERCNKCHEPGRRGDALNESEEAQETTGGTAGDGSDDRGVAGLNGGRVFATADAAFTDLIRAVDACQRGFAHEKLYGDVLQSLNLAYEDFRLWRKAFRQ